MRPRRQRHLDRDRRGFTLIELLVVISIIGILVGLLLPAVNSAREAGRRTQCQNNMRQLGLGLINFTTSHNSFPNSGVFADSLNSSPTATTSYIYQSMTSPSSLSSTPNVLLYSWVVEILPYLDAQDMYNAFDKTKGYAYALSSIPGQASNLKVSSTAIGVLRCPDDYTSQPGQGNLSYACNSGFSFYTGVPVSFTASIDGSSSAFNTSMVWTSGSNSATPILQRLGVMFPGTDLGSLPWDYKTTPAAIADGMSNTLLLSENTLAGVGTTALGINSNWACPLPQFVSFIGSPNVCGGPGGGYTCTSSAAGTNLYPGPNTDGPNWIWANNKNAAVYDYINYGQNITTNGLFPFSNSAHPGGCNMVFCDGAVRFITATLNGTVYSKILTPAGSRLPVYCRQLPVSQDDLRSERDVRLVEGLREEWFGLLDNMRLA